MMKPPGLMSPATALALMLSAASSLAQSGAKPEMLEKPVALPQTGTGTAPDGGNREQADTAKPNPESASQQPEMATGQDLKGPPMRFPAQQTPE